MGAQKPASSKSLRSRFWQFCWPSDFVRTRGGVLAARPDCIRTDDEGPVLDGLGAFLPPFRAFVVQHIEAKLPLYRVEAEKSLRRWGKRCTSIRTTEELRSVWEKKEEEEAQAMDHGESDQEESVRQQLSSYRNCLVHHLHHHQKVYYILCMNLLNLPHDFCLARILDKQQATCCFYKHENVWKLVSCQSWIY